MTVSRLDGTFCLGGTGRPINPGSGALAGLAKTAVREWPEVHCKAVDLDVTVESPELAAAWIVDELITSGPSEVGLSPRGRISVELEPARRPDEVRGRSPGLGRGDLVVITGGARGITAEVAIALAGAFQPRLLLLGRSPEPVAEDDALAHFHTESELKRALLSRSDRLASPGAIGEQVRQIMAAREVRHTLARITEAGSPVIYRSVNVRDEGEVRRTLAWAREQFGPVRGLIHGAGVLADRKIADQTDAQFDLVYETKVEGLHHVFGAIEAASLELLVLFSSSTARFGRPGQVAYAAANEYLNKWAQCAAVRMPHCRVVSFNWGPWAGGMVTDALRPMFEKEGLGLIPPDAGAGLVIDEIRSPRNGLGPVEILVLAEHPSAKLPFLEPARDRIDAPVAPKLNPAFRRDVNLKTLPILADHVIDGHAVLPMVMILEWAGEAALQRNPGFVLRGVDDLRLFKGVILNGRDSAAVDVLAGKAVRRDAEFVVPIELRGTLPNGREIIHARADVILGDRHPGEARRLNDRSMPRLAIPTDEIYGGVLFHGPALQGIERVEGCDERSIAGTAATSPPPSEWVERPLRSRWLTDPLAIDCAFQLVVLWCREHLGANSLPTAIARYRQFGPGFGDGNVRILAEIRQASDARAVVDIEIVDARGDLVARLDAYECVVDQTLNQAFLRGRLIAPSSVVAG